MSSRTIWTFFACVAAAGCANLAGIGDGPVEESSKRSVDEVRPRGALGGDEKKNTEMVGEDLEVSPVLDFGPASCGERHDQMLTVKNAGKVDRTFTLVIPEGTPFSVGGQLSVSDAIHAGEVKSIPITARPVVGGIAKANIVVTMGSSFAEVPVGILGQGGVLDWSMTSTDLGNVPYQAGATTIVKLTNNGTDRVSITGFVTSGTTFTATPGAMDLAPGKDADVTIALKSGSTGIQTDTVKPLASGLCAAPPVLNVSGRRIDTTVTVTGADWGKMSCQTSPSQADTRAVVVKNYNVAATAKWTVTKLPTLFTLEGPASGTVDLARSSSTPSSSSISFRPPTTLGNPGLVSEDVTVHVDAPGAGAGDYVVKLRVDVRGAVVTIAPTDLTFTNTKGASKADYKSFSIQNTGNDAASLSWKYTRTAGEAAWLGQPQSTYTNPGTKTVVTIGYQPMGDPPNTATLEPRASSGGAKICNPEALEIVNLTGTAP